MATNLFMRARAALAEPSPVAKAGLVRAIQRDWAAGLLGWSEYPGASDIDAGFPDRLEIVSARRLPDRKGNSLEGRIALFHAVAHIEFSAINLALDAVAGFGGMPAAYYEDWLTVAGEEVSHFELLEGYLRDLGASYGDLPAHGALWEAAVATRGDLLERMAVVPRYLEARGLDVNPAMQERLRQAGDHRGVEILEVILRDEIGHVARGDAWFRYLCEQRGVGPEETYREVVSRHIRNPWRGPFHCVARRKAGFSDAELARLGCPQQG